MVAKIGIIGLGLIGGSMAKALKHYNHEISIMAFDKCQKSLNSAIDDGVVSIGSADDLSIVKGCQIIFMCTPVKISVHILTQLAAILDENTIVTDVCSTKEEIVSAFEDINASFSFIGGHPMAGSEKNGYEASFAHLFENAYYVLCPSSNANSVHVQQLSNIISKVGAIPLVMAPRAHDFATGCISHLPHVIASAIVNFTKKSETSDSMLQTLAAGGFKDITRIASSSPEMWQNISISNKSQLIQLVLGFQNELSSFLDMLKAEDSINILDFFESAKSFRDTLPSAQKGLIPAVYELSVAIPDKPGIIGEIATLLGDQSINIKNIQIINSRELDAGCLKIDFADLASRKNALELLKENHFVCVII